MLLGSYLTTTIEIATGHLHPPIFETKPMCYSTLCFTEWSFCFINPYISRAGLKVGLL